MSPRQREAQRVNTEKEKWCNYGHGGSKTKDVRLNAVIFQCQETIIHRLLKDRRLIELAV
jgi:hypothetical protein